MAFDETTLSETHEITCLSIQSNTQISPKATNVISKLSTTAEDSNAKPALVILRAQSRWASKLITIVEIAKRDLESTGRGKFKVFQYSSLSSEIVEIERKPKSKALGASLPEGEVSNDDDEGTFQTMGAATPAAAVGDEGGLKKRAVPVLTVYLTGRPIKALRSELGEQMIGGGGVGSRA